MKRNRKIYSRFNMASAAFLVVTLLWLTVSTPFLFASQQHLSKQAAAAQSDASNSDEESSNPVGNTTEEKVPSGNSLSEEYTMEHFNDEYFVFLSSNYHKGEDAGTYTAFHGELLVPPPNVA